ncbi:MAG: hypothetical protein ABSG43_00770 [Solirubrobacteraceae bacterium]
MAQPGGLDAAAVPIAALRAALASHRAGGAPAALDAAFAAATAAVAALRGNRASQPADTAEIRSLLALLPDYRQLVEAAVGEARRSAHAGASRLWQSLGIQSAPPTWNEPELEKARMLVALAACDRHGAQQLGPRLQAVASRRWASLLVEELRAADEAVWRCALAGRYESVRRRCAPRTRWRTGQLCDLLGRDASTSAALQERLRRWLADGCDLRRLALELEAAFVQTRTPDVIA